MLNAEIWEYNVTVKVIREKVVNMSQVHTNTFKRTKETMNSDPQMIRRTFIEELAREVTKKNKQEEELARTGKKTLIKKLIVKKVY